MRSEDVWFYSHGARLSATWNTPDDSSDCRLRALVHGPGWLGLKDAKLYRRYHEALTSAGFGVLVLDYRGFGESEGDKTTLSPRNQLEDLVEAVTYLTTRDDVDAERIGVFGTGGTGGGNAVMLAGHDDRVRAAVCQVPIADGHDWLHRMRREHEWIDFLADLEDDRRRRALKGSGRLVDPREEIMLPTPERRSTEVKSDVDSRVPVAVSLASAEEILAYRPAEAASRLTTPLLVIAVENDATTPTDHAVAIYEAAKGPRKLIMQRHTSHYAAYDRYWELVTPHITAWFERYLVDADVVARTSTGDAETIELIGGNQ